MYKSDWDIQSTAILSFVFPVLLSTQPRFETKKPSTLHFRSKCHCTQKVGSPAAALWNWLGNCFVGPPWHVLWKLNSTKDSEGAERIESLRSVAASNRAISSCWLPTRLSIAKSHSGSMALSVWCKNQASMLLPSWNRWEVLLKILIWRESLVIFTENMSLPKQTRIDPNSFDLMTKNCTSRTQGFRWYVICEMVYFTQLSTPWVFMAVKHASWICRKTCKMCKHQICTSFAKWLS